MLRLHVQMPLSAGAVLEATPDQAHYLGTVMRRKIGDPLCLFNGHDGAWSGCIESLSRGKALLRAVDLMQPQATEPDLWLVFAPLKRDLTDLVVQKATELGVSALLPAFTERTNAARVNENRLRAIAVEAAEQSERLTVPELHPPRTLAAILDTWPAGRRLFVALERATAPPVPRITGPAALLIGPEGGFGPKDRVMLDRAMPDRSTPGHAAFVQPISLGPRILRAETAAIVGLALLQTPAYG